MAYYPGWPFVFVFLGFVLIAIATMRDSWTESVRTNGSQVINATSAGNKSLTAINITDSLTDTPSAAFQKHFGTIKYKEVLTSGFGYIVPCPTQAKTKEMNHNSDGMVFTLLVANISGFFASLFAILACTRSTIVNNFKNARNASIFAFVGTVVSWALWLRSYDENLKLHGKHDCRFAIEDQNAKDQKAHHHDDHSGARVLGGSFALCVVASGFYLILFLWTSSYTRTNKDVNQGRYITLFIALVAFACIFVASTYNVWTESTLRALDNQIDQENNHDNGQARIYTEYGVYTAYVVQEQQYRYNSNVYRPIICPLETLDDGTGYALANAGRVTLGFAITAIVLGFFAFVTQLRMRTRASFWLSVGAFACILVCLIVWGEVADVVIKDKCCAPPQCQLGASYGIAAVAAGLFFLHALYQAWAVTDDIYVLHDPQEFGMSQL